MRSTRQLYLIHCRYRWQSLTFNAQSHRKGMEKFFTNSANANSSRVDASEVSGVSKTIWQLGTSAEILATRK